MDALVKGALIGISIAAPPGPNALMCMSRTLTAGRSAGLRAGLGAASAHAVYAGFAVLGVDQASKVLLRGATPVRVLGGVILLLVGLRLGLSQSGRRTPSTVSAYPLTFAIGLVNPLTLLYFTAAVALGTIPAAAGSSVVAGVFIGSTLWWTALTQVVATLGHHLDERRLARANRLVAAAIATMGAVAVGTAL